MVFSWPGAERMSARRTLWEEAEVVLYDRVVCLHRCVTCSVVHWIRDTSTRVCPGDGPETVCEIMYEPCAAILVYTR